MSEVVLMNPDDEPAREWGYTSGRLDRSDPDGELELRPVGPSLIEIESAWWREQLQASRLRMEAAWRKLLPPGVEVRYDPLPEVVEQREQETIRELFDWMQIPADQVIPAISPEEAAMRKRLGLPRIMMNDAVYFSEDPTDAN